jgi:hypothetical protein
MIQRASQRAIQASNDREDVSVDFERGTVLEMAPICCMKDIQGQLDSEDKPHF